MLDQPVSALTLSALDFETTGLSPHKGDRVVEVAVVRGKVGDVPEHWATLVHPERAVDATHIHGITDQMVANQPPFSAVLPELLVRLEGTVLVVHNAGFDLSFLEMECQRAGVAVPALLVIDTLGLARRVLAWGNHSLSFLVEKLGLPREHAHRALDDAHATWHLAALLLKNVGADEGVALRDVLKLCQRRSPRELDAVFAALNHAKVAGAALLVDYVSPDHPEAATRRSITVLRVTRREVDAFCHLRGAERTFRLDRLRLVGA
jgi:DNA polymerase III epsilon subunit family exonuclease